MILLTSFSNAIKTLIKAVQLVLFRFKNHVRKLEEAMQTHLQTATCEFKMTKHAEVRAKQRGVRRDSLDIVFRYADVEENVGSGCYNLSLSRSELARLLASKVITASQAERCKRLKLVAAGNVIITNYKAHRASRG